MKILAFDTSTENLGVCLATDSGFYTISEKQGFRHSEKLLPDIKLVLDRSGIKIGELDLIVCPSGPGSFTGLRIGIATAKGLKSGTGVPMVTVPTLDMMAWGLEFFDGHVFPVIDARKNRFYTAVFEKGNRASEYMDIPIEDVCELVEGFGKVLLTGPAAEIVKTGILKVKPELEDKIHTDKRGLRTWSENLVELGPSFLKEFGPSHDTEGPLYLRKSEAEIGIKK